MAIDMKQFLDDLKNVNPKTPGAWPMPVKLVAFIGLFVLVVGAGAVMDWQDQWNELSAKRAEEERLKGTFLAKKREAVNLDLIKKQLIDTQQSFGALLKQLPSKSEMDALLTDINQAGLGRGLQVLFFKPGSEKATGVFTEQPITIKISGSYDDLGRFASDISQLPRIVTLNDISISVSQSQLVMDTTAKTYRYLDEEELAAQKRAARAAAGAK